jgi:hypothetical protein
MVHNTIAQVTTRKMSDGSFDVSPGAENTPFDSATPEIRKPISPRAHIASARMSGGCSENGFGGLGELRGFEAACGFTSAFAVLTTAVAGAPAVSAGLLLPQKWDGRRNLDSRGRAFPLIDPGLCENLTSQSPQTNFANAISTMYTIPRHTIEPLNILVIGIEKPTEAKNSG